MAFRAANTRLRAISAQMASSSPIPVYLVGPGLVGTQVLEQLTEPHIAKQLRIDIVSNSRYQLHIPSTSDRSNVHNLVTLLPASSAAAPKPVPEGFEITNFELQDFVKSLAERHPGSPKLFIDCTSSQAVADLYPTLLQAGISVVTPNKKAFSGSQQLYSAITSARSKQALVYQESTVGAGLPIIGTLNDLVATGDRIVKIEGVLSGTLSYIFNSFSKPLKGGEAESFSSIVKVAKEQGYTEPHPADDLSGSDVARKLCILSRLVPSLPELEKGYESVPTETLIPSELASITSGEEFVKRLPEFDSHFEKMRKEAEDNNQVLRYVGVIDAKSGKVQCGLERYAFSHPFASSLSGSDNIISFYTSRYSKRPLIVQGAGAGAEVTAMGVVADCLKVAERLGA